MAQTDTRAGFRLPWNPDRTETDEPVADAVEAPVTEEAAHAQEAATPAVIEQTAPPAARRATKLMADFSRAMQVAAEASRDETMARFTSDAKAVVEEIHNAATEEVAALRRHADDDIAAVREWSKAEIARVREETEARIGKRKTALDGEIEAHGATIDTRVERVGATVSAFEAKMAAFFERLLAEEDPTRIATMAETMPEPPDLAGIVASVGQPTAAPFDPVPTEDWSQPVPDPVAGGQAEEPTEPAATADADADAADADTDHPVDAEAEVTPETVADVPVAQEEPDFAAAEAEAASFSGEVEADDRVAAALAAADEGSPLPVGPGVSARAERGTTRVTVTGLVSVASIATFKRSLGRVPGVNTIGVSSGPDGEFVFTVTHDPALPLAEAIIGLPGFEARITAQATGEIGVAAHDPDGAD